MLQETPTLALGHVGEIKVFEITLAIRKLDPGPIHFDANLAPAALAGLVRRVVADDVVSAEVLSHLVENLAEIIRVDDRFAAREFRNRRNTELADLDIPQIGWRRANVSARRRTVGGVTAPDRRLQAAGIHRVVAHAVAGSLGGQAAVKIGKVRILPGRDPKATAEENHGFLSPQSAHLPDEVDVSIKSRSSGLSPSFSGNIDQARLAQFLTSRHGPIADGVKLLAIAGATLYVV